MSSLRLTAACDILTQDPESSRIQHLLRQYYGTDYGSRVRYHTAAPATFLTHSLFLLVLFIFICFLDSLACLLCSSISSPCYGRIRQISIHKPFTLMIIFHHWDRGRRRGATWHYARRRRRAARRPRWRQGGLWCCSCRCAPRPSTASTSSDTARAAPPTPCSFASDAGGGWCS